MLAISNHLFVFYMFENSFQEGLLQQLSRNQCEDDQPVVPWILFLEDSSNICLLPIQSSGTSPDYHDPSKIIENGLAMTSASSFTTHGCVPPGCPFFLIFPHLTPLLRG